ncbi:nucleotidyltransferase domain-containing protein [Yoonia sp.]|jgi:lincosamide nucleotidyltransferase A/C/D/E|uniref:nucleotidyltransferase domain-containing protein n=1 Tax=Yoonia sp. TaxID=2212373 RepID=UPI004048D2AB
MDAKSVVRFWEAARAAGLDICIDGGWAVDALLGEQTRPHGDLDIALPASQGARLRAMLEAQGYCEVPWPDSWAHNFVLEGPSGARIDVHTYELHPDGRNKAGVAYIAEHLSGSGVILGNSVRCVPPHWLVLFHDGYAVDEDDWHDVRLLCARFGLPVPEVFERFVRSVGKP